MIEIKAHCKINLGLRVVRRREDGFHDIETVMLPVRGLYDTVSVEELPSEATFVPLTPLPYPSPRPVFPTGSVLEVSGMEVSGMEIDCPPEQNICMKALRLVQREYGTGEAVIRLHKAIPTGAGLGGGSSDAAAVLRALDREFALELPNEELEALGGRLGSDVPFFVREGGEAHGGGAKARGRGNAHGVAQLCTGRGETMTPAEVDLTGYWLAIVKPPVAVSTAEAYAGVVPRESGRDDFADRDARDGFARTDAQNRPDAGIPFPEILKRPIGEWRDLLVNDFEKSVFAHHPEIGAVKQTLYEAGARYASMSGSGSAVFGIFEQRPEGFKQRAGIDNLFIHIERL